MHSFHSWFYFSYSFFFSFFFLLQLWYNFFDFSSHKGGKDILFDVDMSTVSLDMYRCACMCWFKISDSRLAFQLVQVTTNLWPMVSISMVESLP